MREPLIVDPAQLELLFELPRCQRMVQRASQLAELEAPWRIDVFK
jgi:hypothetical protein